MLNGRKNATVGLTGLLTFILLEIGLAAAILVVGIEYVFDPDWPFIEAF
jgi:hypothetical protein